MTLVCDILNEKSFSKIEKLTWKSSQTIIAKYHIGDAKPTDKSSDQQQQQKHDRVSAVQSNVIEKYHLIFFLLLSPPQRYLNSNNFSLHISPVQLSDSGDFSCTVNDKSPLDIIELVIHDVPEPPSRPMITSFTSRSVNLSWAQNQHPKNEQVTDFILETRYRANYDDKKVFIFSFYCTSAKIKVVSVDERERNFIAFHNSRCAHTELTTSHNRTWNDNIF